MSTHSRSRLGSNSRLVQLDQMREQLTITSSELTTSRSELAAARSDLATEIERREATEVQLAGVTVASVHVLSIPIYAYAHVYSMHNRRSSLK